MSSSISYNFISNDSLGCDGGFSEDKASYRWYILQVRAGSEESISRLINKDHSMSVAEVMLPSDPSLDNQVKKTASSRPKRKLFPGYIFLKMKSADVDFGKFVALSNDVYKFLSDGDNPKIIPDSEIAAIKAKLESGDIPFSSKSIVLDVGDMVKIDDDGSPFDSFVGKIKCIDRDSNRATVGVVVFGKEMSVDLDLSKLSESD